MPKAHVLPADVFMALALVAEEHGGIGSTRVVDPDDAPCCAYGIAGAVDGLPLGETISVTYGSRPATTPALLALQAAGIEYGVSDFAVQSVRWRMGLTRRDRVPFDAWATALNIEVSNA